MIQLRLIQQQIKAISILEVADRLGIGRKRNSALCFMHDDKNPSLVFNPKKNTWKCYVCDKGGDQVALVMNYYNLSFPDACKWLADQFNLLIPEDDGFRQKTVKPKVSKQVHTQKTTTKTVDKELLSWIIDNAGLSADARNFLFVQRKYKKEIIEMLKIKSISDPNKLVNLLVKKFGEDRLLKTGIIKRGIYGLYLPFGVPCLVFPYYDANGEIMTIQTRYLGDKKAQRFHFLSGAETGMFNRPILTQTTVDDKLFVAEGVTDCIALLSSGRKAVAIPSATLLRDDDVRLLASKNLYMYPDKDNAGENLYNNLRDKLGYYGSMVMKLELPEGCKDYSDYYIKSKS